ncbi:hypothetical protein K2X33_11360 [bacterium]|nr:hypothetical protein [bacterium]
MRLVAIFLTALSLSCFASTHPSRHEAVCAFLIAAEKAEILSVDAMRARARTIAEQVGQGVGNVRAKTFFDTHTHADSPRKARRDTARNLQSLVAEISREKEPEARLAFEVQGNAVASYLGDVSSTLANHDGKLWNDEMATRRVLRRLTWSAVLPTLLVPHAAVVLVPAGLAWEWGQWQHIHAGFYFDSERRLGNLKHGGRPWTVDSFQVNHFGEPSQIDAFLGFDAVAPALGPDHPISRFVHLVRTTAYRQLRVDTVVEESPIRRLTVFVRLLPREDETF